jgi:hypothetical protein
MLKPACVDHPSGILDGVWGRILFRTFVLLFAVSAAAAPPGPTPAPKPPAKASASATAQKPTATKTPPSRTFVVIGLGKGVVAIDGDWQFALGDNPQYANPDYDDSSWEKIGGPADQWDTWGAETHPSYTGFAWYRRHVDIRPSTGTTGQYEVLINYVDDAYEVYWNGKLIGSAGKVPPHASWFYTMLPHTFPLVGSSVGVLAIRVWKSPLTIFQDSSLGGLSDAPIVGDPDVIQLKKKDILSDYVRGDLFDYSLVLLRVFIGLLGVVLWYRNRAEQLFLWVAVFTVTPVPLEIIRTLFLIPIPYGIARFFNQPLYLLYAVSLWYLLVWLLNLHENKRLVKWTNRLAWTAMGASFIDGVLALFWGQWAPATHWMQWANAIVTAVFLVLQLYPFVLVVLGFRHKLDISRILVAVVSFALQGLHTFADASAFGRRFTQINLWNSLIWKPLFSIQGVDFAPERVLSLGLFAAILFATYRYILEAQERRMLLEREVAGGREIQQVLVPDEIPQIEGFSITGSYTPMLEVGGDFFQVIPNDDGSAIIAIGDVSGKGIKAGMNVSMIVGVLRAEAGLDSPAEMLASLNRCLVGRMSGGFATGVVFRLGKDGTVTFANAGHLAPFLNGQEFPLDASLPLGLISYSDYSEITMQMQPGDQLTLYTDGVLEATNPDTKELFGFERMSKLFASRPSAAEAARAAIEFGQDDDVTVLTITRHLASEQGTASV